MEHFKEQINSKSFFGSLSSAQVIKLILFKYLQINQKVCDIVRDAIRSSMQGIIVQWNWEHVNNFLTDACLFCEDIHRAQKKLHQ